MEGGQTLYNDTAAIGEANAVNAYGLLLVNSAMNSVNSSSANTLKVIQGFVNGPVYVFPPSASTSQTGQLPAGSPANPSLQGNYLGSLTQILIKGHWFVVESVDRHYINGNLVSEVHQDLTVVDATIDFYDTSYTAIEAGAYPSVCTGTYALNQGYSNNIKMTGCDLEGQHEVQKITYKELVIFGEKDGSNTDYEQVTLVFRR